MCLRTLLYRSPEGDGEITGPKQVVKVFKMETTKGAAQGNVLFKPPVVVFYVTCCLYPLLWLKPHAISQANAGPGHVKSSGVM